LRAFLHFDLVRLFCPDYVTNPNAQYGVPYADTYDLANKTVPTLKGTYERILQDLNTAESILANDTIVKPIIDVRTDYDHGRTRQFNLYAVYATKARVYYTMGDNENAAKYAKKVIDAKDNFSLTESRDFANVRRFPADKEMIFGLNNKDFSQSIYNIFVGLTQRSGVFTEGRRDVETLYETKTFTSNNIDVRFSAFYRMEVGASIFLRYVANESEIRTNPLQGFTLIRLPEMYYILAESLYDTDVTAAKAALDEVRKSRGLQPVADAKLLTKDAFLQEMLNERMREMPGEGQVFFALKHYNKPFKALDGRTTIEPSVARFVLPRPDRETEFGNKQQ
jgi:putative lipoprotein